MDLLIILFLGIAAILIPLTLVPHIYSLFKWRWYSYYPAVRLKSALWGLALLAKTLWDLSTRYDIIYNDRRWFGEFDQRLWLETTIAGLIMVAVIVNTIVYWRVVRPGERKHS